MAQISEQEMLRHFASELQSGDAALFVGAGFSRPAGYVDWNELMRDIASELGLSIEKESDLIAIAQYHVNERGGRARINRLLIDEFTKDAKLTENHRLLASLPIHTVWTTNYDDLLETAFRENHRRPDVKTTTENLAQTLPNRDVVIYKMHGDIRQPQDAVVTKEDYETYEHKRSLFSTALKGDLVERTFLFLGFSFTDLNIDHILSRIRGLLGQSQRGHYCIMKWPDMPKGGAGEARAEYEYKRKKLELRISDLSRYQIHAVMVDSYDKITDILGQLNRLSHRKHVFVSGSADSFEPFGRERLDNLCARIGRELIRRGYKLVSGFGRGIGGAVALGALEHVYSENLPLDRVSLFPFPQGVPEGVSKEAFYTSYRMSMLSNSGFAFFIAGNREDSETKKPAVAPGVIEEFEIACRLGNIPVPLGASGWAAQEIWKRVSENPAAYYGDKNVTANLKVLGDPGKSDDDYVNAIFQMLKELGR
jgi:hypothetical protein